MISICLILLTLSSGQGEVLVNVSEVNYFATVQGTTRIVLGENTIGVLESPRDIKVRVKKECK